MSSTSTSRWVALGAVVLAIVGVRVARATIDGNTSWGTVPYEGMLEHNGTPVNGNRDFCFRLFDAAAAAAPIWAEKAASVPVIAGRFSVRLGAVTPFNPAVEAATNLRLQVAVAEDALGGTCGVGTLGDHTALDGMQQLGASGFAISAKQAVPNQDFLVTGKLGVGRAVPVANLDVAGTASVTSLTVAGDVAAGGDVTAGGGVDAVAGVRAGSQAAVTACGAGKAAGEGMQRYNYATHAMEYCNGSAWTPLATAIQGAKAWVRFTGTVPPVIQSSYNVSSVTRAGAGDYTIHFASPMANTGYAVAGVVLLQNGVRNVSDTVQAYAFGIDGVAVQTGIWANGVALRDEAQVSVVVFGD